MKSNDETFSRQNLWAGNIAKSMTSEGKSAMFLVNDDRRPPLQRSLLNFHFRHFHGLMRDGLFTSWKFGFDSDPWLHELKLLELKIFISKSNKPSASIKPPSIGVEIKKPLAGGGGDTLQHVIKAWWKVAWQKAEKILPGPASFLFREWTQQHKHETSS